jgi:HK97 family phage prohead protease
VELRAKSKPDERVILDVTFSDETLDAHESVIKASGWKLDRYRNNPIVIWGHNSHGEPNDVIGKAENVRVDDNRLHGDVRIVPAGTTTKADEVWGLVQADVLRGVSVGFRVVGHHWERPSKEEELLVIDEAELVELSLVPVPSNPNTLIQQVRSLEMAKHAQQQELERAPEKTTQGEQTMSEMPQVLPPKLAALLGVEDISGAERAISALKLGQEQLEKRNAELQSKLDAIEAEVLTAAKAEREAVVDDLIMRGVIGSELREHALTLAAADMSAFKALYAPKKERAFEALLQKQISTDAPKQKREPKKSVGAVAMSHREIMDKLVSQGLSLEDATIEAARQLMEV